MVALAGRSGGRADLCADHSRGAGTCHSRRPGLPGNGDPPGLERVHTRIRRSGRAHRVHCGSLPRRRTGRGQGGNPIGSLAVFRDNTPDGATVATDHMISDWEAISLAPDVAVNDILPGGRVLVSDASIVPTPGLPVCHFGVITGESCGNVESVNNGWFTMANGVVSQKGDSGGPVYVVTPDGRAAIVGMFNSTWGNYPAAVSWQTASQQAREDVVQSASGTIAPG